MRSLADRSHSQSAEPPARDGLYMVAFAAPADVPPRHVTR